MRKKLAMLTVMALATAAAILSNPYKAEAACSTCCNNKVCTCCTRTCQCPIPGWTGK